jgi:hypothetical protein
MSPVTHMPQGILQMVANVHLRAIGQNPDVSDFLKRFGLSEFNCSDCYLVASGRYAVLFNELLIDNLLDVFVIDLEANLRLDCNRLIEHYLKSARLTRAELLAKRQAVDTQYARIFLSHGAEKLDGVVHAMAALNLLFADFSSGNAGPFGELAMSVDKSWIAPFRQCIGFRPNRE